ncbi:MAG: hypothetical protein R2849_15320 [Thermomicrobiales bacterium]
MTGEATRPRRDGPRVRTVPRPCKDAADMLRVIRNHRRAAYDAHREDYED